MPKTKTSAKKVASKEMVKETEPVSVVDVPQVSSLQSETLNNKFTTNFSNLLQELQQMRSQISNMITSVRTLQKGVEKEMKSSQKKKKEGKKSKREPSGFAKPTVISKDLCTFLSKPLGTEMARTEVTKYLTQYIKENNLQKPEDKRKITPDDKLSKLLNCSPNDEVTYFNLQKWMKPHFESASSQ